MTFLAQTFFEDIKSVHFGVWYNSQKDGKRDFPFSVVPSLARRANRAGLTVPG